VALEGLEAAAVSAPVRRVNVPNLGAAPPALDFAPAIFWLGSVGMNSNYADVRVWYFQGYLKFVFHITDRVLWHDPDPRSPSLTAWDAVSLYIDLAGNVGQAPGRTSYWFVKQLWNGNAPASKAVYRGTGSGWAAVAIDFTTADAWRGNYPNDDVWDMGWQAEFEIPFSSLGLEAPPLPGTVWGLAVAVHDRDDAGGTPIADQIWPERSDRTRPDTWGQLHFGRPAYPRPEPPSVQTTVVRHGLEGAVVRDAAVGGHGNCGGAMNAWTEWGNANYAGYTQVNIQNQWDIADFMCFSKYYVTFPLTAIPAGKSIVSARVILTLFGNAGYGAGDAKRSAINALTVSEEWEESAITWNNAPLAAENLSVTWVYPIDASHPAGPYEWDVSYAVARAYAKGEPLRLVLYSTDGDYHSGKYFWSSDVEDWNAAARPTLEVQWGAAPPAPPTGVTVRQP